MAKAKSRGQPRLATETWTAEQIAEFVRLVEKLGIDRTIKVLRSARRAA